MKIVFVLIMFTVLCVPVFGQTNAADWFKKGFALELLNRYDEAVNAYDKVIEIDPQFVQAWESEGRVFSTQGKYNEAIKAYDKAIEIDPQFVWAWGGKGFALLGQGKNIEALRTFDRAIELNSQNDLFWTGKGAALYELNRKTEANAAFAKGEELRGVALYHKGKYEDSLRCYDSAIQLDPNDAAAWQGKSLVLHSLGRNNEAEAAFTKAKELGYTG